MAYLLGLFLGLILGTAVTSALAAMLVAGRYPPPAHEREHRPINL
jgi:hypothetical protein